MKGGCKCYKIKKGNLIPMEKQKQPFWRHKTTIQAAPTRITCRTAARGRTKAAAQGRCSGPRVEPPLLRKRCLLHCRGAYFQNITFPGPVEKGHRDVVNHMPWRSATRHCVHSVMLSCMTPLCCKQCVSTASTDLARR